MTVLKVEESLHELSMENNDFQDGWVLAYLSDVGNARLGKTPRKSNYRDEGIHRIVKFRDVTDKGVAYSESKAAYVVDNPSALKVLRPLSIGDVLVTASAHSGDQIGKKCAYVESLPEIKGGVYFVGELLGITSDPRIMHSKWPYYWFLSEDGFKAVQAAVAGVHLTNGRAQNIPIPIAPVDEQNRIIQKLDELLYSLNATKDRLTKVSIILKRFRQAVLAAACSGRLTADWHEANRVQDDFEESTIGEIAEYFGGFAYKSKIFLKQGQHQVIRIGNVRLMSLNLQSSPVFIPDHIAQQTERFRLHPDDIVISMTGTKYKKDYGFAAIVRESNGNLFLNQRVARLRCGDRALPKYLLYWLQTDTFHDFFFAGETGNVNQGNVGADGIRKAPIKLPSLCEQHEIVRRVESMFKLADAVEKRVAFATARAKKLTQAILAKAFRGELVPTEAELARCERRPYEPASELLARIKSERDAKQVSQKVHRNRN